MAAYSPTDEVGRAEDKDCYGGEKLEHDASDHDVCSGSGVVVDLVSFARCQATADNLHTREITCRVQKIQR